MNTTTARKTTATIELEAELVAKIRASIRAVRKNQTLEEFVEGLLVDMLEPHSGLFEGLIQNEQCREKIEGKLDQIRRGDPRLVHREPLPRNAVVYQHNLERLRTVASSTGNTVNSALNSLLNDGLNQIENGTMNFVPNIQEGGAA